MQNSNLKNSLIAAGIAVFAGVITLGANVAFGVTNPAQQPADATLVSPTFGGLDVRGDIKNGAGGGVNIEDSLTTKGDATFKNKLTSIGDFYVGDPSDPSVFRSITLIGNTMVKGLITAKLGLAVNGDADINGDISNSAGNVTVADNLDVNGGLTINPSMGGVFVSGQLGKLPLNSDLWVGGKNYSDPLSNSITIDGDAGAIIAEEGTLTIPSALEVHGAIKNPSAINGGNVVIDDNITVNGKVTSSLGFGTIRRHDSAGKAIAGGATGSDKVTCDTTTYPQEKLISCEVNQSGWGYINAIVPDYNVGSCTAYVKNTDAGASTLTVYAMCLDSAK